MRTVGIIAEYNPFHTGHSYHLAAAKKETGAEFAVVVMSPDFVQRGTPAIFDKHTRAQMALACGADLVLELPVCYAAGSAEYFARGAVSLLDGLNAVKILCFGSETAEPQSFLDTAEVLEQEPPLYRELLRAYVKSGMTFPAARARALEAYLTQGAGFLPSCAGESAGTHEPEAGRGIADIYRPEAGRDTADPYRPEADRDTADLYRPEAGQGTAGTAAFLSSPNNLLGVEYCRALLGLRSPVRIFPLERRGDGYHSTSLDGSYCSASAIRSVLTGHTDGQWQSNPDRLNAHIPEQIRPLFEQARAHLLTPDDFLPFLFQRLLRNSPAAGILDVSPDLSDRIAKLRFQCIGKTWPELVAFLKTRQFTEARIRRALLHLILDIRSDDLQSFAGNGTVFYARILGFRREAAPLLHQIRQTAELPLLSKMAAAEQQLADAYGEQPERLSAAKRMLSLDLGASHLYQSVLSHKYHLPFRTEFEKSPVILH